MSKKKQYARWAIFSDDCGLYTGQWLTRRDAIAAHVHLSRRRGEPEVSRFAFDELDDDQKQMWADRRKNGDRAVKVIITVQ